MKSKEEYLSKQVADVSAMYNGLSADIIRAGYELEKKVDPNSKLAETGEITKYHKELIERLITEGLIDETFVNEKIATEFQKTTLLVKSVSEKNEGELNQANTQPKTQVFEQLGGNQLAESIETEKGR